MKTKHRSCVQVVVSLLLFATLGCAGESAGEHRPKKAKQVSPQAADGGVEIREREPEPAAASGCDAIELEPPAEGEGVQVAIEIELEPGKERQVCRLARLDQAVNVNWSEGRHTLGSHHGFTTKTSYHGEYPKQNLRGETVDDATVPHDCESSGSNWDSKGVLAYGRPVGAHNPAGKGLLPDDVAVKLAAGDIVQLNFHMINLGKETVKACYKQNLYGIPDEQVRAEAGTIFWYHPFVTVPANGSSSATMACPITEDVTLADQVSHMHRRGVGYAATLLDGDPLTGAKQLQTLYEGTEWDEPIEKVNTPALSLKKGQWISFTCDYENPESRDVAQGQQTTDEMCMFIGTYWPRSREMDTCQAERLIGRVFSEGEKTASELVDCWSHSPQKLNGGGPDTSEARYASQKCISDSCPNASAQFIELMTKKVEPGSISCD